MPSQYTEKSEWAAGGADNRPRGICDLEESAHGQTHGILHSLVLI